MSEEIRVLGREKVHRHDHRRTRGLGHGPHRGASLLGNGDRLDLVSVPGATLLRREDGTEVARFSVWDATRQAIEQAAQEDRRTNQLV